jgi:uncharacterized protein (DUF2344 family)
MNLLGNKKVFITESAWLALLDSHAPNFDLVSKKFHDILEDNYKVITSAYVIDAVLQSLKSLNKIDRASYFIDLVDKSTLSGHLKVFWLNRRLRQKAIYDFIHQDFKKLDQALNIRLIQQKNINCVLTLDAVCYNKFNIPCLDLNS